jgi:predicted CoA-binding protein
MQVGIISPQGAAKARSAGLLVVMDHCMREEHRRLVGQRILPNPP